MTAKDLKNALLQEAVQGKLVPQIASEGNARELLEEIRKEKAKHIKEGKIKKEKPLPEITEDEIPFDIPENWCWCRLGDLVPFGTCQNAEPNEIKENDWILDLEDIEKDSGKILAFKTKKQVDSKSTKHIFKEGYVLYSKLRPYLNKCVIAPKNGFCTSEILPLAFGNNIYNKYAQIYLMSPFFVDYTNSLSFGVKMPRLGTEDGKKALFPLPPLAEQKRIVAAIEKFMPLIEEYGKKETELKAFNEQIGTLTKKAILQEAVQGKLVPQIAAEGNAKDLLEEIKKEKAKLIKEGKIKKEKPLPEITEDEISFDIPENWCWCRLGNICNVRGGKRIPAGRKLTKENTGHKYIRVTDMKNGTVLDNDVQYITDDIYEIIKTYTISKDDVYITVAGTIGQAGTIPEFFDNANLTENADKLELYNTDKKFLVLMLSSPYIQKQIHDSITKVGQPKLAIMRIQTLVIALPPLAEQKRIVAAIEKMLPFCEKLGE